MSLLALLAAAARTPLPAGITPLPPSADKELSVRCLIYTSAYAANADLSVEDKKLADSMRLYWLGRVNGEFPHAEVASLVPEVSLRLKPENIEREQEYCGSETAGRTVDLERGETQLQSLIEAAEAQRQAK